MGKSPTLAEVRAKKATPEPQKPAPEPQKAETRVKTRPEPKKHAIRVKKEPEKEAIPVQTSSIILPHSVERSAEVQAEADQAFRLPYEPPMFDITAAAQDPESELAQRELCRRHLLPFIQRFRPKYKAGWVHADICRRLERFLHDVEDGKEPRLLLLCPPRMGKSEIGSRHFAPWVMGHHPEWEIIAASHTSSLTMSFSRYIRDMMMGDAYSAVFPDTVLDPSSRAVENWNTTKGGGYLAAGVGTGITGRGAHCLPLTERIVTSSGVMSLEELIKDCEAEHYVLSSDGVSLDYRRINAFITREVEAYYRLTFDDGTVLEATGEHPVCVDLGGNTPQFRRVDDLRAGESVVTFARYAADETAQGGDEVPRVWRNLQSRAVKTQGAASFVRGVNSHVQQQVHGGDANVDNDTGAHLPGMRERVQAVEVRASETRSTWRHWELLLKRMLWKISLPNFCWGETSQLQPRDVDLHALQEGVPSHGRWGEVISNLKPVLHKELLRGVVTWSSYPEGYRSSFAQILPARIQAHAQRNVEQGGSVCRVYVSGKGSTPSGRRPGEQQYTESCPGMQAMSQATSRRPTSSRIVSIERVEKPITVGDIEVEGAHNFVHDSGKLLLNCLIIDDVVKDIEAADSLTIRDNTWEWYISTAYTRLAPGGGVLGILTWWHEDDWAGRIQQAMAAGDGDKFEIVRYPAINEAGDEFILPDDTIMEISDPKLIPPGARMTRPKGTAIHPERYSTEAMLRIKRNAIAAGMKRTWDALYQQNPIPDEGNFFSKEFFRFYSTMPARSELYVYQAWDFAISEGKESDYNVGITIGVDHRDSVYVMDLVRFKTSDGNLLIETVVDYAKRWSVDSLGVEDGQIWKALESQFQKVCEEKRYYPSFEVLKPLTDKMVRANPLRGRMQAGRVYFDKNATYWTELQKEMLHFPAGKHDDQIDALSWAVRLTLVRSAPKQQLPKEPESWKDKLWMHMEGAGATHMAA